MYSSCTDRELLQAIRVATEEYRLLQARSSELKHILDLSGAITRMQRELHQRLAGRARAQVLR